MELKIQGRVLSGKLRKTVERQVNLKCEVSEVSEVSKFHDFQTDVTNTGNGERGTAFSPFWNPLDHALVCV